ncbi:ubiquitin-associated protein 2- hypothetical protein [Limosa lapponica baueri]|uniref:Uncharacterized protein n=1 Tax=Limosa lapponica baueri TaxID=1758121 RepID=A0A2I0TEF5_LIMLA|nr:ubiquitin-associated protein 2- hypothetical protein [Limosa lapponica baueri]
MLGNLQRQDYYGITFPAPATLTGRDGSLANNLYSGECCLQMSMVPPASAKQHGVNMNNASTPFQQASGYGQHGYGAGYDDLTQGTAAGEYSKGGYSGSSQAQNKSAGTGPGKGNT